MDGPEGAAGREAVSTSLRFRAVSSWTLTDRLPTTLPSALISAWAIICAFSALEASALTSMMSVFSGLVTVIA